MSAITFRRLAGAAVLAAAVVTTGAGAAAAASDFGDHVVTCARTDGFNADHNPGMHQGYHAWSPDHTC